MGLPWLLANEQHVYFFSLVLIWAIFALGFDFAFGAAGLLSFGHAAFFGLGGYIIGMLTLNIGMPFIPALALCAVGGAVLALGFAVIALRSSGIFFAILTLILAQLIAVLLGVKLSAWTGGADGMPGVPRPELFGVDFNNAWNFATFIAVIALALIWLSVLLRASPFGQVLSAVRQNRVRARQIGFSVERYSAVAFVISGAYSGIAGGLNASLISFVGPEALNWTTSGDVVVATLIGGVGSTLGPVVGVVMVQGLNTVLGKDNWYQQGLLGLLFIVFSIFLPKGLWGLLRARRSVAAGWLCETFRRRKRK
jgi:branched-chain amino acid transport system permease protein